MTIRAEIADMTDAEAVEFLLRRLEDPQMQLVQYAKHLPTATKRELQMLAIMLSASSQIVSYDYITARFAEMEDVNFDMGEAANLVSRIRKHLNSLGIPITIRSRSRLGYEIITPPGCLAPWDEEER